MSFQIQSNSQDRVLVMGATNRPYELDNAALRRFPKRIYIGLPDVDTRVSLLKKLLETQSHSLNSAQIRELAHATDGYSGSDLTALAKDAALGPIREQSVEQLKKLTAARIRPLNIGDFRSSLLKIRQSTPRDGLTELEKWNSNYGDINAWNRLHTWNLILLYYFISFYKFSTSVCVCLIFNFNTWIFCYSHLIWLLVKKKRRKNRFNLFFHNKNWITFKNFLTAKFLIVKIYIETKKRTTTLFNFYTKILQNSIKKRKKEGKSKQNWWSTRKKFRYEFDLYKMFIIDINNYF